MYMLTAFFISFLLILVDNSLVDDNVGNQSHYNQNGRTAQDGIVVNIAGKFFNKPFMCVYFNRLLYSCHKEKHNSLTSEIIFAKNPYFNKEWKMRNEK